jgi:hypothetical protein
MSNVQTVAVVLIVTFSIPLFAAEAPREIQQFNVICPAAKLLPVVDAAYNACNNGYVDGSCEKFVEVMRQLLPAYDCQRPFDASPTENYGVPAIWLAGNGAMEDYIRLLLRMASPDDKMFSDPLFEKAATEARKLFGSKAFQNVLDGELAEDFRPLSEEIESELQRNGKPAPLPPVPADAPSSVRPIAEP